MLSPATRLSCLASCRAESEAILASPSVFNRASTSVFVYVVDLSAFKSIKAFKSFTLLSTFAMVSY